MINAKVMEQRAIEILNIQDVLSVNETLDQDNNEKKIQSPVFFRNFTGYWNKDSKTPCLENINLTIQPGQVTAVIGKIGSGKTSFIFSFLNEIPITSG